MKAWLKSFGYSDAINDAAINFILREFVMSKVSCDELSNMDMIVELLRPQLEVTKEDIEPFRQAKWPEPNSFGLWHGEKRSNKIQPVIFPHLVRRTLTCPLCPREYAKIDRNSIGAITDGYTFVVLTEDDPTGILNEETLDYAHFVGILVSCLRFTF